MGLKLRDLFPVPIIARSNYVRDRAEVAADAYVETLDFFYDDWWNIKGGLEWIADQFLPEYPTTETQQGTLLTRTGNVQPIPVIYGTRRVGGIRVFDAESGANNEYLHAVYVLSEGEISAINSIWIGSDEVTNAMIDANGNVTSGKYSGLLRIKKHLGADSQVADADLVSDIDEWTTSHKLSGIAYVYIRFKWDQENRVFGGYPRIQIDIDGRKIYDPRDGLTKFSTNNALAIYDYLINARYGHGIQASDIETQTIIDSANYCDELVTPYGGAPGQIKRYEINAFVETSTKVIDNIKLLLGSCRGRLPYYSGKFRLVIDRPQSSVFSFDNTNMLSAPDVSDGGKKARKNRVSITYTNPEIEFKSDVVTIDSPALRAEDNGLLLEKRMSLPSVDSPYRVNNIASIEMKASRQSIVCSFRATLAALGVVVGDVCDVTSDFLGWANKTFRVMSIQLLPDATVSVSLREYEAGSYNPDLAVEYTTPPNTTLPNPNSVKAPTNLSLASGNSTLLLNSDGTITARIKVTWTPSADNFVRSYDVEFKKSADSNWIPAAAPKGQASSETYIVGVQDGTDYDVRIRARNTNDAVSDWVIATNYAALGKSASPPNITTFSVIEQANGTREFSWILASPPVDLAGYQIRYSADTNAGWSVMTPLHDGLLTASPWETNQLEAGTYKFAIVAVDTSGNISLNMRTVTVTVGEPPVIGDTVDWQSQVTGEGKPDDGATVGATWGSNLVGQPADTDLLNQYATVANYGKYLGDELAAGHNTSERVDFLVTNNTGTDNIWYKVVEWSSMANYDGIGIAGLFQHGRTGRPTYLQLINFGFNVGILPAVGYVNYQKQMEPDGWAQMCVYQDYDASGNPRITVYFIVRLHSSAVCSFDIFRKRVGATKIWQRGLDLGAGYTPAGTEIPFTLNRGVQDYADITSLNTSADTAAVNGRAAADVESDAAAGATYTGDTVGVQGGLLPNWACNVVAPNGKPAGIRGVESVADQSGIAFGDSTKTWIRINHATDATIAYGWPAIPIDDQQQYRVTIRHRADVQATDGLYLRFNELDAALPSGKTHVGHSIGESVVAIRSSLKDLQANGPFPASSWVEDTYIYTPTAGTQWASFSLYNWRGNTINYDVDAVMITPVAKTADQIAESSGRKWAGQSGADKTQSALESTVSITSGGIDIGGNYARIRIGGAVGYLNGDGIFAGRDAGVSKFHVGDPDNESYLAFDGTDMELGRGTELRGADSFYNESVYSRYVSAFSDIMELIGDITLNAFVNHYTLVSGTVVGGGDARISRTHLSTTLSWSKFRAFSTVISLENSAGKTWYFGIGDMVASAAVYAAFKIIDGDVMGAVRAPGGSEQTTSPFYHAADNTEVSYLLEFFPADRVDFYVDGVLRGSISVSAWSSSNGANVHAAIKVIVNSASPEGRVNFSEIAFFQDKY